jgi:hypothetical protein
MTTSKSDVSWDDICVNPHQAYLDEGQQEGSRSGAEAGFHEGYESGRTMAIEYGMELGFIKGVVGALRGMPDVLSNERVSKTIQDLLLLLDSFPSPDDVFRETDQPLGEITNDNEDAVDDIRNDIQRIKARFKLLTAQLGMPHFSLKQVMDDAKQMDKGQTSNTAVRESSW